MILPSTVDEVRIALDDPSFVKLLSPWGIMLNTGLLGQPDGFTCPQRGFKTPGLDVRMFGLAPTSLYEFTAHPVHPLMYVDSKGNVWQCDRHFFTDRGSIPSALRWKFSPDETLWFFFHDSGYMYHGLFLMDRNTGKFNLQPLTRDIVDNFLHDGYMSQWSDGKHRANMIWSGVRIGGSIPWNGHRGNDELDWREICQTRRGIV